MEKQSKKKKVQTPKNKNNNQNIKKEHTDKIKENNNQKMKKDNIDIKIEKSNDKKKLDIKKYIIVLFELICIAGIVYSITFLIIRQRSLDENNKIKDDLNKNVEVIKEEKKDDETGKTIIEEKVVVDFATLKEQNPDTVAYLKIKNSNIDYPVVKAENNEYYLNHNFNKQYNTAGWIFADYKNKFDGTDKNIVIYGHSMKDGSMFGQLYKLFNSDWINDTSNYDFIFNTALGDNTYRVFSMYRVEEEDYYITTNFNSDAEFGDFIRTLKSRSYRNFNIDVSGSDQIITLSTCTSDLLHRIVVHAKKIS